MAAQVLAPFTVLLSLLAAVGSASNVGTVYLTPKTDIRVGTTLANGKSFQAGFINNNVRWQASGILTVGGCLRPGLVLPRVSCFVSTVLLFSYESVDHFVPPSLCFGSLATRWRSMLPETWSLVD